MAIELSRITGRRLTDWQQRVVAERTELSDRLNKLMAVINSPDFNQLNPDEQRLVKDQSQAMALYLVILADRIEHFK